jgi:DNA-directed RNA polymerase I, II, and III subunit RPABC5
MIIPVKCFTCGKVLADKWEYYVEACKKQDTEVANAMNAAQQRETQRGDTSNTIQRSVDAPSRAKILDELKLQRMCCRRHFLGHIDLMDVI